jgi:fermentation-respiration switch protein FrsA (DUF1100 family)
MNGSSDRAADASAPNRAWRRRLGRGAWRAARVVLVAYLLLILMLLFLETKMLYPAPRHPRGNWETAGRNIEEARFESADGTKLHGWYFPHPEPRAVLIYFHGNAEHTAYAAPWAEEMRESMRVSMFVFDYRGYGRSEGSPHEAGIVEDCRAARAWLAHRTGEPIERQVLIGRSLGGGAAVIMAAESGARGLILQNTPSSLPDAAAWHYPWAPVHLLMKNRFDAESRIGAYRGPLLQSHGGADDIVPISLGRKLHAAANEPKTFLAFEGIGHNDYEPLPYFAVLDRFLDELPDGGASPPSE